MPIPFLDHDHPTYEKKKAAWLRDERRLFGGDPVIAELTKFKGEADDSFTLRTATARYTNFPDLHMTTLVGHLAREAPEYTFGSLGVVRPLADLAGQEPKLHELFFYNCDGIGNDGSQYPAWRDSVKRHAGATGVVWVMAEMPSKADLMDIRRRLAAPGAEVSDELTFTGDEQRAGFRVFLRKHSPLEVHDWKFSRSGTLLWAVIHVPLDSEKDVDESGNPVEQETGRYLLVRKGYTGLGDAYSEGGWWLYNEDHEELDHVAGWEMTRGEIPLWRMFSLKDDGTTVDPSMGRSLSMEIGQIGIDLMNMRSEQRYNLRQAAKTIIYMLGIQPKEHGEVIQQLEDQSIVIAVPPVFLQDGTVGIPQIWCSSQAAIDAGAFSVVQDGAIAEAREIMVKQVTSEPGSSGESKKTGFEEANSPLLAGLAQTNEEFDNMMLHFVLLLMGLEPDGSVTWTREFKLRDLVDDIDSMIDTIKRSGLSSPTLEMKAIETKAMKLGLLDDETEAKKIHAELEESVKTREDRQTQESGFFGAISASRQNAAPGGDGGAPPPTPGAPA